MFGDFDLHTSFICCLREEFIHGNPERIQILAIDLDSPEPDLSRGTDTADILTDSLCDE